MNRDKMGTEVKYVQLEAMAFLANGDFQLMTAKERGIYCTLIFYLLSNGGKIKNEPERIKKLCNSAEDFEKSWKNVLPKFSAKNGYLKHKRVTKELIKAKKFIQGQRAAGVRGAKKRWGRYRHPNNEPNGQPVAKENKVKQSKVKEKNIHTHTHTQTGTTERNTLPVAQQVATPSPTEEEYMSIFEIARKKYPSTKKGLSTEFANFVKKHSDWKDILPLLLPAIEQQIIWRREDERFWKNFQTWINQRSWEEEPSNQFKERKDVGTGKVKQSLDETYIR